MSALQPQLLLKVVVLASVAVAQYISFTSPNASASTKTADEVHKPQLYEYLVAHIGVFSKVTIALCMIIEAAFAVDAYGDTSTIPESAIATLCPYGGTDLLAFQTIQPMLLTGASLAVLGASIRIWTYRVLAHLFTFQVALRPSHKLVTSAPYNIVRHPGYTALFIHTAGLFTTVFATGGWVRECGIIYTPAVIWLACWVYALLFASVSIWKRGDLEDGMLKQKFGDEWTAYARRVPHKFFPGLA